MDDPVLTSPTEIESSTDTRQEVTLPRPGFGAIDIPFDFLGELLGMPSDMNLVGLVIDPKRRTLTLTVQSPQLPLVDEGETLPEPQVLSKTRIVRVVPVAVAKK